LSWEGLRRRFEGRRTQIKSGCAGAITMSKPARFKKRKHAAPGALQQDCGVQSGWGWHLQQLNARNWQCGQGRVRCDDALKEVRRESSALPTRQAPMCCNTEGDSSTVQPIFKTQSSEQAISETSANVLRVPLGYRVSGSSIGHRHARVSDPGLGECPKQ
jgi:hypothetical protein